MYSVRHTAGSDQYMARKRRQTCVIAAPLRARGQKAGRVTALASLQGIVWNTGHNMILGQVLDTSERGHIMPEGESRGKHAGRERSATAGGAGGHRW